MNHSDLLRVRQVVHQKSAHDEARDDELRDFIESNPRAIRFQHRCGCKARVVEDREVGQREWVSDDTFCVEQEEIE